MLARVPDTGSPVRDRHGPRPAVRVSLRDEVRSMRAAGVSLAAIADAYRLSIRTIYRYCAEPEDLVRSTVAAVVEEARGEFGLELTRDQVDDIAVETARRLRAKGLA